MPSTMVRNSPQEGLLRSAANQALDLWFPPEDDDGICTAQNVAVGTLNINGAMVKNIVTNGRSVLPHPACPVFTFSQVGDACTIEMAGTNQWGEPVVWNIAKAAGANQYLKVLPGSARIPPMWTIDYIKITTVSVGTGTVSVGFNYVSGNSQSIALPISLGSTTDLQGASSGLTRSIYVEDLGGNWTAGPWPGFPSVTAGSAEDIKRGVLAVTLGTTKSANITAATFTNATLTLSKTGAFANYNWQNGDFVTIVSGTAVTPGDYNIASRVSDDAIVLEADIGGANPADVVFNIISRPQKWGRLRLMVAPEVIAQK